jgi:hypothetical protein
MTRAIVVLLGALWAVSAAWTEAPPEKLFSSYAPLNVTLEAAFNDLRHHMRQGTALYREGAATYSVTGTLSYTDPKVGEVRLSNVEVSGRGHTSFNNGQCDFPKLKLKFPAVKGPPPGSLFDGVTTVKVNTHCGEGTDDVLSPIWGRLQNEHSPIREAFVFRLLETLRVPSLKARPVQITYVDVKTTRTAQRGAAGVVAKPSTLVRNAMFLEDAHQAESRFGANGQYTESTFGSADARFAPADSAGLAFAEALIGNFDWCVRFFPNDTYRCDGRHRLWNVLALKRPNASALPMPYDFDLAGMVTGHHRWFDRVFNPAFAPGASEAALEVLGQLQRTRSLFTRAQLDAARAEFVRHKPDAYAVLAVAQLDDAGRRHAAAYLDAFYAVIESDERFYLPAVVADNTQIYLDARRSRRACANAVAPRGTVVSAPLETRGEMQAVLILDALWQWAPPGECEAVHSRSVWMRASSISPHYPS